MTTAAPEKVLIGNVAVVVESTQLAPNDRWYTATEPDVTGMFGEGSTWTEAVGELLLSLVDLRNELAEGSIADHLKVQLAWLKENL